MYFLARISILFYHISMNMYLIASLLFLVIYHNQKWILLRRQTTCMYFYCNLSTPRKHYLTLELDCSLSDTLLQYNINIKAILKYNALIKLVRIKAFAWHTRKCVYGRLHISVHYHFSMSRGTLLYLLLLKLTMLLKQSNFLTPCWRK